jgi:hypothetical protein
MILGMALMLSKTNRLPQNAGMPPARVSALAWIEYAVPAMGRAKRAHWRDNNARGRAFANEAVLSTQNCVDSTHCALTHCKSVWARHSDSGEPADRQDRDRKRVD